MFGGSHESDFHNDNVTQYGSKMCHRSVMGVMCDTTQHGSWQCWHKCTLSMGQRRIHSYHILQMFGIHPSMHHPTQHCIQEHQAHSGPPHYHYYLQDTRLWCYTRTNVLQGYVEVVDLAAICTIVGHIVMTSSPGDGKALRGQQTWAQPLGWPLSHWVCWVVSEMVQGYHSWYSS